MNYVLGFLMNEEKVVLIRKKRGNYKLGVLNGLGGKVEPNETLFAAMVREFKEEAGILIEHWGKIGELNLISLDDADSDSTITVYSAYALKEHLSSVSTQTDEEVAVYALSDIFTNQIEVLFDAKYLIMIIADYLNDPLKSINIKI